MPTIQRATRPGRVPLDGVVVAAVAVGAEVEAEVTAAASEGWTTAAGAVVLEDPPWLGRHPADGTNPVAAGAAIAEGGPSGAGQAAAGAVSGVAGGDPKAVVTTTIRTGPVLLFLLLILLRDTTDLTHPVLRACLT